MMFLNMTVHYNEYILFVHIQNRIKGHYVYGYMKWKYIKTWSEYLFSLSVLLSQSYANTRFKNVVLTCVCVCVGCNLCDFLCSDFNSMFLFTAVVQRGSVHVFIVQARQLLHLLPYTCDLILNLRTKQPQFNRNFHSQTETHKMRELLKSVTVKEKLLST